jgi:hypothetical protein
MSIKGGSTAFVKWQLCRFLVWLLNLVSNFVGTTSIAYTYLKQKAWKIFYTRMNYVGKLRSAII